MYLYVRGKYLHMYLQMPPLVQNPELDSCCTAEPKQGTCDMQHDDTTWHGMAYICTYTRMYVTA